MLGSGSKGTTGWETAEERLVDEYLDDRPIGGISDADEVEEIRHMYGRLSERGDDDITLDKIKGLMTDSQH
jgi:hypothetical protein